MNNNTISQTYHSALIPIKKVLESLNEFSAEKKNKMDQEIFDRLDRAESILSEYVSSKGICFLHEIRADFLSGLRIYLRVFTEDSDEATCVKLMGAIIKVAVEWNCINPTLWTFWSKISPVAYFRDHTPLY
jgi:hypothetical protein